MRIDNTQPNINNNNNKIVSHKGFDGRQIITTLGNSDSLMSTIALETFVTGGRGINAYKRGGEDEFRERFIDDVVSAVFWMKGVDIFNSMGDKFGKNVLKLPHTEFDVGKDALRTPFENLSEQIKKDYGKDASGKIIRKLAIFKFTKIILATLLSTSVIGFIMPRINQAITEKVMQQKKLQKQTELSVENTTPKENNNLTENYTFDDFSKKLNSNKPSFKGSFVENMTQISHTLENHTICKMLTNDAGIITGRTVSSRNQDEAIEYLFRDVSSLFFYFASTPLIYGMLQKITNTKGLTEIDPVSAKKIHENMKNNLDVNSNGMNCGEFKKKILGNLSEKDKQLINNLEFKSDVISLEELKKHITDKDVIKRAEAMSQLQPEQAKAGAVLTKQQVEDVFKNGTITQPDFMKDMYKERFGKNIFDKYRYISMDKIIKYRENIDKYVETVIENAKKENKGIVSTEFLEKADKKSFGLSSKFRIFSMSVSALCLGFLIPKLQYMITEKRTGSKSAPMFRDYE